MAQLLPRYRPETAAERREAVRRAEEAPSRTYTADAADARALRGIPAIGPGSAGSAIAGTSPATASASSTVTERLEPGLRARVQALLRLIRDDPAVDRELAFSYAVWPTEAIEAALPGARGRSVSSAELERMAELAAQGMTHRQIGERLGRPRATVSDTLRRHAA